MAETHVPQWVDKFQRGHGIGAPAEKHPKGLPPSFDAAISAVNAEYISMADDIFEDGKFIAKRCGDMIKGTYTFKTLKDNGVIYVYDGGVYVPGGEATIKAECNKLLGEDFSIHRALETIEYIRTSTYASVTESDKELICLSNGIYDFGAGALRPHDPELFILSKLPLSYEQGADCPVIKKFLREVLPAHDIPVIQELIGYCLHKDYPIQKAFIFLGDGANGKSTLLGLLGTFLGRANVSGVALQALETDRFSMSGFFGRLANICADLPDIALRNTGRFKMLTGGDVIEAQKKFKDSFLFANYAKLIFSANKLPPTYDDTVAFFRRWVIVNFPNKFEGASADKKLLEKLTTDSELSGLFNYALEGLRRLLEKGDFSNSISTEKMHEQYTRASSPVGAFVMDCLEFDPESSITKAELYGLFGAYCREKGLPAPASNIFGRDLPRYIQVRSEQCRMQKNGPQVQTWRGIKRIGKNKEDNKDKDVFSYFNRVRAYNDTKIQNNPLIPPIPITSGLKERIPPVVDFLGAKERTYHDMKAKFCKSRTSDGELDTYALDEALERLKSAGLVFQPTPNTWRKA